MRVNPASTGYFADDLAALAATEYRTVMLAKCEGTADLVDLEDFEVIALCETARGVLAAADVAALPNVSALMWGAEDLVASLGGSSSRHADGRYRDVATHARSQVLLAAGAHGVAAIDTVHLEIADAAGLRAEAEDAAALGFAATACIHPRRSPSCARPTDPTRSGSSGRAPCSRRRRPSPASSRSAAGWWTRPCCARRRHSCVAPAAPERNVPNPVLRCEDITPLRHHSGGHADTRAQTIR